MPLAGRAKEAAEATIRQYEGLAPGVAAVAKETVGRMLVTEGWTGLPSLAGRNTPSSISSGAFLFLFGAVWLGITSTALFGSQREAPLVFVLVFPAVGVGTFLAGCWQLATGAAKVVAGRSLQRAARAARAAGASLSPTDEAAVVQSVSSTYRHLRNPNLAALEAELATSPELAQMRAGIAQLPPQLQELIGLPVTPPPAEPPAVLQSEIDPYAPGAAGGVPEQWPSMPLSSRLPLPAAAGWAPPVPDGPVAPPGWWPPAPPITPAAPAQLPSTPAPVPPPLPWPAATTAGEREWRSLSEAASFGGSAQSGSGTPPRDKGDPNAGNAGEGLPWS